MATTTATLTVSSDIASSALSLSKTKILKKAGTDTDFAYTTGLVRLTTATGSNTILLNSAEATANYGAASGGSNLITKGKVYITNLNARGDGSKFVTILLADVEIGRLYGGDFMFIPWDGGGGNDLEFTANDTTSTTIEYCVFYE
jgi:hypothetical protein